MATPFIVFLGPSKLEGFQIGAPLEEQPPSIPEPFLDAMEVRQKVFVKEQKVAAENEFDADDPRCCHWIVYASVNKSEQLEVRDEHDNLIQPRKSVTRKTPIGTIRLVPFPHDTHPVNGGKYWNGELQGNGSEPNKDGEPDIAEHDNGEDTPTAEEPTKFVMDRPTSFHNGKEPYVKLGRLAVVKEFRGHRIAGLLVNTVLAWLKDNSTYFDPSIKEFGLESTGATSEKDIPSWSGLVCAHAQKAVVQVWKKWGFEVDEEMGAWEEEGIPHVGMWKRIEIERKGMRI